MIGGAAAVALLIGGVLVFYAVRSQFRDRDAAQAATTIDEMLRGYELDDAASYLDNLEQVDPDLLRHDALVGVRKRYDEARKRETRRIQDFKEAIDEAEHAPLTPEEPEALAKARTLARLESEKQAVEQIAQRRQAALKEANAKREAILRPSLDRIGGEIHQIGRSLDANPSDYAPIRDAIDRSSVALHKLAPEVARASEDLQGTARMLEQQLEEASDRYEGLHRQSTRREEITEAIAYSTADRPDLFHRFVGQIQGYLKAYPDAADVQSFQKVLKERPLWDSVEDWNHLVADWKTRRDALTPREARRRAGSCSQFLAQHSDFPGKAEITAYLGYVEAIARRDAGADSPAAKLRRVFSEPIIAHTWMVVVKYGNSSDERCYTREKPEEKNDLLQFSYALDFEKGKKFRELPITRIASRDWSPQTKIANEFKPILANETRLSQWEAVMIDLLNAIFHQPEIDPILQADLIRIVIQAATEGSEPLRVALEPLKNQLLQAKVNWSIAWINPETPGLLEAQEEARRLILGLRPKVPSLKAVLDVRDQIEERASRTYQTVGWLARDGNGYQVCRGTVLPPDRDLLVIAPSTDSSCAWKKVGEIDGGKPKIDTRDDKALVVGRPVFVMMSTR